jgi:hypothetical protein
VTGRGDGELDADSADRTQDAPMRGWLLDRAHGLPEKDAERLAYEALRAARRDPTVSVEDIHAR